MAEHFYETAAFWPQQNTINDEVGRVKTQKMS